MELIALPFEPATLAAFRRVAFDRVAPAQAAAALVHWFNAVRIANSRALSKLRQKAQGLID
jgi:hypothetical protein